MAGLSMNSREQMTELFEQTADKSTEDISRERGVEIQLRHPSRVRQRTPQIHWWHLKIVTFANLEESWISKNSDHGCDQQS